MNNVYFINNHHLITTQIPMSELFLQKTNQDDPANQWWEFKK